MNVQETTRGEMRMANKDSDRLFFKDIFSVLSKTPDGMKKCVALKENRMIQYKCI